MAHNQTEAVGPSDIWPSLQNGATAAAKASRAGTGRAEASASTLDLSIVIVNWNTRDLLRECLESIHRRAGEATLEVIVVDNDSTDGSAQMAAAEFPQVRLICNSDNRGFAVANNQGIEVARGATSCC
jgi:cellulose synthase/poly-beta-1,6-N-acetylglucosamine synthase-like glycosyltransferase